MVIDYKELPCKKCQHDVIANDYKDSRDCEHCSPKRTGGFSLDRIRGQCEHEDVLEVSEETQNGTETVLWCRECDTFSDEPGWNIPNIRRLSTPDKLELAGITRYEQLFYVCTYKDAFRFIGMENKDLDPAATPDEILAAIKDHEHREELQFLAKQRADRQQTVWPALNHG